MLWCLRCIIYRLALAVQKESIWGSLNLWKHLWLSLCYVPKIVFENLDTLMSNLWLLQVFIYILCDNPLQSGVENAVSVSFRISRSHILFEEVIYNEVSHASGCPTMDTIMWVAPLCLRRLLSHIAVHSHRHCLLFFLNLPLSYFYLMEQIIGVHLRRTPLLINQSCWRSHIKIN